MNENQLTIKSLDGLRGLAVLFVLLSHLSLHGMNLIPLLDFSGFGKVGVYLFFVLSAFLLTYQALDLGDQGLKSARYWLGYFIRRVCRIYPLYCVVLIVAWVLSTYTNGYGPRIPDIDTLIQHLLLQAGSSVYWAIPAEFTYYLALPVVCLSLFATSRMSVWLSIVMIFIGLGAVYFIWPPRETIPNTISLGPYLQMFLLGSLLALLVIQSGFMQMLRYRQRWFGAAGWVALLIAVLTIPSVWRAAIDPAIDNKAFHTYFLFYGLLWSVTIAAALSNGAGLARFFESRVWCFLGRISFSIYLWHLPVVQWVDRETDIAAPLQFSLAVTASLILSYISYRLIERPFISWGHRYTSSWRERTS